MSHRSRFDAGTVPRAGRYVLIALALLVVASMATLLRPCASALLFAGVLAGGT